MLHIHHFRNWFMQSDKLPAPWPQLSPHTEPDGDVPCKLSRWLSPRVVLGWILELLLKSSKEREQAKYRENHRSLRSKDFLVLFLNCTYMRYFPFSSSCSHQHSGLSAAITVTVHIWLRVSFAQRLGGGFQSTTYEKESRGTEKAWEVFAVFFFPPIFKNLFTWDYSLRFYIFT